MSQEDSIANSCFSISPDGEMRLKGAWTVDSTPFIRKAVDGQGRRFNRINGSGIERLDTAGAYLINEFSGQAQRASFRTEHEELILKVSHAVSQKFVEHPGRKNAFRELLEDTGRAVVDARDDLKEMLSNLGHILVAFYRMMVGRTAFRFTSVIYHMEYSGLRATPIIALMSFLIGGIIAQQAAYQLRYFGAELLTVDLAGILIMREIGLLLAAIMFAGRSGSAFAAELGSMKMREEIDALRTMGLDPIEVLVVPRVLALVIALPLLTIVANGMALGGALIISWLYSGIEPITFITRLRDVVTVNVFFVGLIKAPLMALVIGIVAYMEGMKTSGSAESLGQQVTASVVKAIFMVIIMDGIFAMIFAAFEF